MQLARLTPATLFEIRAPIWNGGKRKVGLATYRISKHNEIRFTYRRKDGELSMPDVYYFDGSKVNEYERQFINGLELVLIPISELEILERV